MVVRPSALQRGGDKDASQIPLERICAPYGFDFLLPQKINIRIQRSQALRVFRAAALNRFWALLAEQKCSLAGQAYKSSHVNGFFLPQSPKNPLPNKKQLGCHPQRLSRPTG